MEVLGVGEHSCSSSACSPSLLPSLGQQWWSLAFLQPSPPRITLVWPLARSLTAILPRPPPAFTSVFPVLADPPLRVGPDSKGL
jgi:hypothetical protein